MQTAPEEMLDPVGEEHQARRWHRPSPPDRALFLVTDRCAAYCRYCTRSRLVSNAQDYNFHPGLKAASNTSQTIRNPRRSLSGGDPRVLRRKTDYLLGELCKIPHIEFNRIVAHTSFPSTTDYARACEIFKRHGPIWMSIHVNHPNGAHTLRKHANN